jgi:hypothetical protein
LNRHLKIQLTARYVALLAALITCLFSWLHIKEVGAEEVVYFDFVIDFKTGDPENAILKEVFESGSLPRPIIGVNQTLRGYIPGVITALLGDESNVIEIVSLGLDNYPLYSFVIDHTVLAQQSIEIVASSLYFGVASSAGREVVDPVIAIEPSKNFKAKIVKHSESFYSIILPSGPIMALLYYYDFAQYEPKPSELSTIKTVNYGAWTQGDWNNVPHVTKSSDQTFVFDVLRNPSAGSFKPIGVHDFASKIALKAPWKAHDPHWIWTLKTEPTEANIIIGGSQEKERTEAIMTLSRSRVQTTVFEKKGFVQCPYEDSRLRNISARERELWCPLEKDPEPRGSR